MPPPPATASSAVYVSSVAYAQLVPASSRGAGRAYRSSCDAFYDACLTDAAYEERQCEAQCSRLLWGDVAACTRGCQNTYATRLVACERFDCGPSRSCQFDRLAPTAEPRCCPNGSVACGGGCEPQCAPGFVPAVGRCGCECSPVPCPSPQFRDMHTCRCVCPACPPGAGYVQDPLTCQCACPSGTVDCGGRCVPLGTVVNCNHCGDVCASGQSCCPPDATNPGYHCADLTSVASCGTCGHAAPCAPNEQCCAAKYRVTHCADLLTSHSDCGTCFHACGRDQTCVNGQCRCITGTPCGQDCCTSTERCCGGQCVDVTHNDAHCGACTEQCNPPVSTCVNSACQCAPGWVDAPLAGASPGCCQVNKPFAYWNPAYPGDEDQAICCAEGEIPILALWWPTGAVCCPPGSTAGPLGTNGYICFLPPSPT